MKNYKFVCHKWLTIELIEWRRIFICIVAGLIILVNIWALTDEDFRVEIFDCWVLSGVDLIDFSLIIFPRENFDLFNVIVDSLESIDGDGWIFKNTKIIQFSQLFRQLNALLEFVLTLGIIERTLFRRYVKGRDEN